MKTIDDSDHIIKTPCVIVREARGGKWATIRCSDGEVMGRSDQRIGAVRLRRYLEGHRDGT